MANLIDKILTFFCSSRRQQEQTVQEPLNPTIPENGDGIDDALRLPAEEDNFQPPSDDNTVHGMDNEIDTGEAEVVLTEINPIESPVQKEQQITEQTDTTLPSCQLGEEEKTSSAGKLISLTVDTIRTYDMMSMQFPAGDIHTLLEDVCSCLVDNLIMAGCTPIGEESGTFNIAYHKISHSQIVEDGTPYSKLIRKGIMYNGEVKLLAIVEL